MIDIHSHILPGIDDGAETMENTVELLRLARDTGTTAMPFSSPMPISHSEASKPGVATRETRSSGRRPNVSPLIQAALTRLSCRISTPLGIPVVPEV